MDPVPPLFACLRAPHPTDAAVAIARDFSPRLERHGPGCVVCDVSGLGRLLGDPGSIAKELATAAAPAGPVRIALAPTRAAALLLTLAHAGPTVVLDDVAAALAGLPLEHLQQFVAELEETLLRRASARSGRVGARQDHEGAVTKRHERAFTKRHERAFAKRHERAFDMARRWGLTTIGELAALPAGELSARMGQDGLRLQQLAQGRDAGPFEPDPDIPRFIERMELEWPIDTLEPLSFVLARLLEPLSAALERADRGAAAIRLDLRLIDRTVHARVLALPVAMREARVLRTLLLLDLESHPPPAAVDIVTIEADPAPGRVIQYSLLERAVPSAETLATLTARLGALVGDARCGSPELLDTHRPDGFVMRRFALPETGKGGGRPGVADRGAAPLAVGVTPTQGVDPRAARADSLARVGGRGGDQGTAAASMGQALAPVLRRFRPPVAVRVTVERGRPVRVAIDRRGMPGGQVDQCAGPWRASGGWWEAAAAQWDRDEWDVVLRDGVLCRLFREQATGTWFVEGVLD